jgi:hypothetical protein
MHALAKVVIGPGHERVKQSTRTYFMTSTRFFPDFGTARLRRGFTPKLHTNFLGLLRLLLPQWFRSALNTCRNIWMRQFLVHNSFVSLTWIYLLKVFVFNSSQSALHHWLRDRVLLQLTHILNDTSKCLNTYRELVIYLKCYLDEMVSNIAVDSLAPLLHVWEIPSSSLDPGTVYPDWGFLRHFIQRPG